MRFATFSEHGVARLGVVDGDSLLDIRAVDPSAPGDMLSLIDGGAEALATVEAAVGTAGDRHWRPLAAVTLLAPIPRPRKNVFCVGRNYLDHIAEGARAREGLGADLPRVPQFFTKPPTTVIGPQAGIRRHAGKTDRLDYEVELAVVIGRRGADLSEDDALDAIFGYTIVNDVTARDAQTAHGQWFKGKSFDSFCPIGPWIVTADEFGPPGGHRIALSVNGERRQESDTAQMLFGVPQILAYLSAALTLEPGDIVATGTPAGVAMGMTPPVWLKVGDVVEAEIGGIGTLRNTVVD